jgi:hypothetical protein
MSAESEGDVTAELGTNYNLGKTITSVCPVWRCPHHNRCHRPVHEHQEPIASSAEVTTGGESGGGDPTACDPTARRRSTADTTVTLAKERW